MTTYIKLILNKKIYLFSLVIFPFILSSCGGRGGQQRAEFIAMSKVRLTEQWDMNNDKIITCDDILIKRNKQFEEGDLDYNEYLDVEEFKDASWGSKAFAIEYLASYDQNNDAQVTLKEFIEKPDMVFQSIDENDDCTISDDELSEYASQIRPRAGRGGGRRR